LVSILLNVRGRIAVLGLLTGPGHWKGNERGTSLGRSSRFGFLVDVARIGS
jgi:hypothetical protein